MIMQMLKNLKMVTIDVKCNLIKNNISLSCDLNKVLSEFPKDRIIFNSEREAHKFKTQQLLDVTPSIIKKVPATNKIGQPVPCKSINSI
jgi:hypothetical protein